MKKLFSISIILFSLIFISSKSNSQVNPFKKFYPPEIVAFDIDAFKPGSTLRQSLNTDKIMKILNIEKGDQIVDIGAGEGYFTIPFSKALKNTGKVFATEINEEKLLRIKDLAEQLNLTNIETVLVSSQGLDQFYRQKTFDLIFMCQTYYFFKNPKEFFEELLPSIKDNGKICIIDPKFLIDFSYYLPIEDNAAFMVAFNILKEKGENFPILNRLKKENKEFILNWEDDGVTAIPENIRKDFVTDLNNMLLDKALIFDLINFYVPEEVKNSFTWLPIYKLYPEKNDFMNWLTTLLIQDNAFDSDHVLTEEEKNTLFKLNFLLIQSTLKISRDTLSPVPSRTINLFPGKKGITSVLSSAGYELVEEYDIDPNIMLIFKPVK